MSLRQFAIENRAIHRLTNSWLLGNRAARRGRNNRIEGRHEPFMRRTRIALYGDDNVVHLESGVWDASRVVIEGCGNTIRFESDSRVMHSAIWIKGDNCRITFGRRTLLHHCDIGVSGSGSAIVCGTDLYAGGFEWIGGGPNMTKLTRIYSMDGCTVTIGDDALLSDDITIRSSDSHPIVGEDGARLNPCADVTIGAHCWIASGATLLKGSAIGKGSIVGAMSLVTRDFGAHERALIAGNPAAVRREGILWRKGESE